MEDITAPEPSRRFSYSAHNMFLKCQYKYLLHYIYKAPKDADAVEDATALMYGKAVHETAELTMHDSAKFSMEMFTAICEKYKIEYDDRYKVYASLFSCYRMHSISKLKAIGFELEIGGEDIIGFIDLVLEDTNGNWRICDLKTSGMVMEILFARLAQDPQLNLYAAYAGLVAEKLGLDCSKFVGVHYRIAGKPRIAPKSGETYNAYSLRAACECHDIFIPKEMLNPNEALEKMLRLKTIANSITDESAEKNRQSCVDYNRPCEHWSHCHGGKTFTQCKNEVKVVTLKVASDMTMPAQDISDLLM